MSSNLKIFPKKVNNIIFCINVDKNKSNRPKCDNATKKARMDAFESEESVSD